jgi:hypothetical protein
MLLCTLVCRDKFGVTTQANLPCVSVASASKIVLDTMCVYRLHFKFDQPAYLQIFDVASMDSPTLR